MSAMNAHQPWTGTWHAVPTSLTAIRYAVTGYADRVGVSRRTREAVALAVSEAASNSIIHGYIDGSAPGEIMVTVSMPDTELLRIVVADDGRGLQPRTDSPGLGLGMPLMASLAERVDFDGNGGGTVVTMDFRRLT